MVSAEQTLFEAGRCVPMEQRKKIKKKKGGVHGVSCCGCCVKDDSFNAGHNGLEAKRGGGKRTKGNSCQAQTGGGGDRRERGLDLG